MCDMGMSPELTPINQLIFSQDQHTLFHGEQVLLAHLKGTLNTPHLPLARPESNLRTQPLLCQALDAPLHGQELLRRAAAATQ